MWFSLQGDCLAVTVAQKRVSLIHVVFASCSGNLTLSVSLIVPCSGEQGIYLA